MSTERSEEVKPRAVVTDIEGTTTRIAFVKEVLFPFARRELPSFVASRGHEADVRGWLVRAAAEIGGAPSDEAIAVALQQWIDEDRKHTALKALQGMIWEAGYRSGAFRAQVYPDAVAALRAWRAAGFTLAVYSSGSVPAQKLLFAHTEAGDLAPIFSAWFDTETGPKRDVASYLRIVSALAVPAARVLFLSDVVEELDAARDAGLATVLVDRREDYAVPRHGDATGGHRRVESFADIDLGE